MLLRKRKITRELILMMEGWRHSNVFCGKRIYPREKRSLENLAAYLIRASFIVATQSLAVLFLPIHINPKSAVDAVARRKRSITPKAFSLSYPWCVTYKAQKTVAKREVGAILGRRHIREYVEAENSRNKRCSKDFQAAVGGYCIFRV